MAHIVKNKYRGTTKYARVLAELVRAAEYYGVTTYQDIAVIMGLPQTGAHMAAEIGHLLGEVSEDEVRAGRPMLSAVVVNIGGKPGPGFFALAKELKRMVPGEDEGDVWNRELEATYKAWRRPLPKGA
jgi:hypothetical protein